MTAVITTAKATSIQPTVSICAVYFGSLVSCSMIEEFDLADYSFVVKRRGNPQMVQKTFRAEFPCAGTPVTGLFERFTSHLSVPSGSWSFAPHFLDVPGRQPARRLRSSRMSAYSASWAT